MTGEPIPAKPNKKFIDTREFSLPGMNGHSGSITDKYCPKIAEIITVFTSIYDGITQVSCQDKEWQEKFGDPLLCRDCKGECLKDLEMPAAEGEGDSQWYKCPRCGSDLDRSCMVSFNCID